MRTFFDYSKYFILAFVLTAFGACSGPDVSSIEIADIDPSVLIGSNTAMMLSVDYSIDDQRLNLSSILGQFEGLEALSSFDLDLMLAGFVDKVNVLVGDSKAYESLFLPVVKSKWELVASFDAKASKSFIENNGEISGASYFIFKTDKSEDFTKLVDLAFVNNYKDNVKVFENGVFKFWEVEKGNIYMSKFGDLFFLTNSKNNRDLAIERIADNKANRMFDDFKKLDSVSDENLISYYVNLQLIADTFDQEDQLVFGQSLKDFNLGGTENFLTVNFDKEGMRVVNVNDKKTNSENSELKLAGKVPSKGTVFYSEIDSLSKIQNALVFLPDEFVKSLGLSATDLLAFMDSPFAVMVSDVGGLYPAISMFTDVEKGNEMAMRVVDDKIDKFVDGTMLEFDKIVGELGLVNGVFTKDKVADDRFELNKVFLDHAKLPEEILMQYAVYFGGNVEDVLVELYYGFVGNNLYTVSLFPNFIDEYFGQKLEDSDYFKYAGSKLNGGVGENIVYLNVLPVLDYLDRFIEYSQKYNGMTNKDVAQYEIYREFLAKFQYLVGSSTYVDGFESYELFLGVDVQ